MGHVSAHSGGGVAGEGSNTLMDEKELEHLKQMAALLNGLKPEDIRVAEFLALKQTVLELKRDADDCMPIARTFFNALCVMLVPFFLSAGFVVSRSVDETLKFDLLAYVFPIVAGWIGGAGIYNRKIIKPCFITMVLLLVAGFVSYLQSKCLLTDSAAVYIGWIALAASLVLAIFPSVSQQKSSDRPGLGWWVLVVFCVMLTGYWLWFLSVHNVNYVSFLLTHGRLRCP